MGSKQYIEFKFNEISYSTGLVIRSALNEFSDLTLNLHHNMLELTGSIGYKRTHELIQCIKCDCDRYALYYGYDGTDVGTEELFNGELTSSLQIVDGTHMIKLSRVVKLIKANKTGEIVDIYDVLVNRREGLFTQELSFSFDILEMFKDNSNANYYKDV